MQGMRYEESEESKAGRGVKDKFNCVTSEQYKLLCFTVGENGKIKMIWKIQPELHIQQCVRGLLESRKDRVEGII